MPVLSPPPSPPTTFVLAYCLVIFLLLPVPTKCQTKTTNIEARSPRQLSVNYYAKSCPQVEQLIGSVTSQQFKEAPVSAPATIRLFFHDCFVEGCDGSILISSAKPGSNVLPEKYAVDNKDLREEGFETVRKAKALLESKCPGVVSCADILAIAARDFVHLAGGPYYQVKKGRWDGKVSMASMVSNNIPHSNSTIDQLIKLFNSKGLTLEDLVVLSGAHTIGFAHCEHFISRLYDYRGTKQPDPAIDPRLLKALRMSCPHFGGNNDIVAPFDVTTPFLFDNAYYGNLEAKLGLLASDQALVLDPRTKPIVQQLAKDKQKFFQDFAAAMEKMGSIGVKRGQKHGVKRKYCNMHL
ncbi:peroxidase 19-like [Tripterygium wilfordii]|uniref:Peroxidase n=1 Tax=Tripterygium wilfordii TaxID=458696 RepID=A0A7J7C5V1_TRIWF|nr:peroxidase 19 [Tripterygium wilfordii]KAF5729146.1 peroxidase 19-like [Tripterygium wilfordii]